MKLEPIRVRYRDLIALGFSARMAKGCSGWYYSNGWIEPDVSDLFSGTRLCGGTHAGECSAICFAKQDTCGPFTHRQDAIDDQG